jgi:hypothetical protein
MKTGKMIFIGAFLAIAVAAIVVSCKKDVSSELLAPKGKQAVQVYLNDDPVQNLYKLLVDIQTIEVKVDTGKVKHDDSYYDNDHEGDDEHDGDNEHGDSNKYGKWDTLSITPGVYDLLQLKNGKDTLIANGFVSAGKIIRLRLTLGDRNELWTDSAHHFPLSICDNKKYVYIKISSQSIETLPNGQQRIRLDVNVGKSVEFEDGAYCFKPKLKSYSDKTTGKIEGTVTPKDANAIIMAFNTTDTAYAIPEKDDDGEFKIKGVKPGTYSVSYKPVAPYKDTVINNIQVEAGQEVKLPAIKLHK